MRQRAPQRFARRLDARFGARPIFEFADEPRLAAAEERMTADSLRRRKS